MIQEADTGAWLASHPFLAGSQNIRDRWYRKNQERFARQWFKAHPQLAALARERIQNRRDQLQRKKDEEAKAKREAEAKRKQDQELVSTLRKIRIAVSRREIVEPQKVLEAVVSASGIPKSTLLSNARARPVCHWRHITAYLLRQRLSWASVLWIGRYMGRDHSTIVSSIQRIESEPDRYLQDIERAEAML